MPRNTGSKRSAPLRIRQMCFRQPPSPVRVFQSSQWRKHLQGRVLPSFPLFHPRNIPSAHNRIRYSPSRYQSSPWLRLLPPLPDPKHGKHPLLNRSSSFQHHRPSQSMLKSDVPQPSPLLMRAHILLWLPLVFSSLHHMSVAPLDTAQGNP